MLRILLVCLVCLWACTPAVDPLPASSLAMDPESLVERFFETVETDLDDDAALEALLSERGVAGLRSGGGFRIAADTFRDTLVSASSIEGVQASVSVLTTIDGRRHPVEMFLAWIEYEERWRIVGMTVTLPEIGPFYTDFEELGRLVLGAEPSLVVHEDAVDEAALERERIARETEAQRENFKAIAATTVQKHDNHWRFNLFARGRSARKVVEEILAGTGVALDASGALAALKKPVRLQAKGISRIEAIERVAAAVGLVPVYPELDAETSHATTLHALAPVLRFEPGQRLWPTRFTGPFLIAVEGVEEHVPLGTGTLTLGIHALGLSPAVLAFQDRLFEHVTFDRLLDKRGRDLHAEEGVRYFTTPNIHGSYWNERVKIELAGLYRSVRLIGKLDGRVTVRLPKNVEVFRWEVERTKPRRFGQRTLELDEWGTTSRFRFHGPAGRIENSELRFSPLTTNYRPMPVLLEDSFGVGGLLTASVETSGAPLRLDIKVCTVHEERYAFSLTDIPLLRFEDMPAKRERLDFEGDSPAQVDFVRFQKRGEGVPEVLVRMLNTSNKDITRLSAEFLYVDAQGEVLGSFPNTWIAPEGDAPLALVVRGMTVEATRPAFFMHADTHSVRIQVTQVEFSDASRWPAE